MTLEQESPIRTGQGVIPYGPGRAVIRDDGTVLPIPEGGSDTGTVGAGEGGEPPPQEPAPQPTGEEPSGGEPGVQSAEVDEQQSSGGQEFIEPYLEGLDPRIRPEVETRLEQFRKDQDAQVNKKFEQLNEQLSGFQQYADNPDDLQVPVAFYHSVVNDPINTLEWLFDRFDQELGHDLRSEVKQMLTENNPASGDPGQQPTDPTQQLADPSQQQQQDPSQQPLTKADLDAYFEQKKQEEQEQQQQEQQAEQQRRQVNGWVDEAASKFKMPLDEDDPLRQTIISEAGKLFEQGQVKDGKQAVEMATESLVNRLRQKIGGQQKQQQPFTAPRIANGGQAPQQKKPDLSDTKTRQDYMLSMLTGGGE